MQVAGEVLNVARQDRKVDHTDGGKFMLAFDGSKRILEAGYALFQTATQRPHGLSIIRQVGQHFTENADGVTHTVEIALDMRRRCFRPIAAGWGNGNQVTGELAAA